MLYHHAVYRIARAETHGEIILKTFYLLESSSIYSSAIYDGSLHHSLVFLLYNALPVQLASATLLKQALLILSASILPISCPPEPYCLPMTITFLSCIFSVSVALDCSAFCSSGKRYSLIKPRCFPNNLAVNPTSSAAIDVVS